MESIICFALPYMNALKFRRLDLLVILTLNRNKKARTVHLNGWSEPPFEFAAANVFVYRPE